MSINFKALVVITSLASIVDVALGNLSGTCNKVTTGTCSIFSCWARRGPAVCGNGTASSGGLKRLCICLEGYCTSPDLESCVKDPTLSALEQQVAALEKAKKAAAAQNKAMEVQMSRERQEASESAAARQQAFDKQAAKNAAEVAFQAAAKEKAEQDEAEAVARKNIAEEATAKQRAADAATAQKVAEVRQAVMEHQRAEQQQQDEEENKVIAQQAAATREARARVEDLIRQAAAMKKASEDAEAKAAAAQAAAAHARRSGGKNETQESPQEQDVAYLEAVPNNGGSAMFAILPLLAVATAMAALVWQARCTDTSPLLHESLLG